MRSAICTILLALALTLLSGTKAQAAGIIYVNINATGTVHDGTSWATAYTSLQTALGVAGVGDQVWVAKGTYLPTTTGDFNASFFLVNGVAVYGGFAGTEPSTFNLSFRNFVTNTTTLSGAIGFPGNNSHHVVQVLPGTTATAVLDGFTITGGNANGVAAVDKTGGGMLIGSNATPTLTNLIISSNAATTEGGGVEIQAGGATVTFTFCHFDTNTSATGAGVITHSGASFTNCSFNGNTATTLAGGLEAEAAPLTVTNCVINNNKAPLAAGCNTVVTSSFTNVSFGNNAATAGNAGGLRVFTGAAGTTVINCTFNSNTATLMGGGADAEDTVTFSSSNFSSNKATNEGGGLEANANVTVQNCIFVGNQATAAAALGGGIATRNVLTIVNSTLSSNTAGQDGGGIAEIAGTLTASTTEFDLNTAVRGGGVRTATTSTFDKCNFVGNSASTQEGGGIDNAGAQILTNCVFTGNATGVNGGGVRNFQGTESMTNCVFANNRAVNGGGFRHHANNTATVTNCTFYGNSVTGTGSAISLAIGGGFNSAVQVVNTIIWNNAPIANPPIDDATQNVTFSDIQGIGYTGAGNISANPLFLNPGTPAGNDGIYRTTDDGLKLTFSVSGRSPCIDSGTAVATPTDILGNPRAINGVPDMGAYEFALVPLPISNLTAVQQDQVLTQVSRTFPLPLPGPVQGTSTNGSTVITTTNTANVQQGDIVVSGPGLVAGSTVLTVVANTSITISAPAGFGAGVGTFFFSGEPLVINGTSTTGSTVITTIDTGNIAVGDLLVSGPGSTGGAKVTAIVTNTSITVSVPFGAGAGTGSFTFTPPALPAGAPLLTAAANSAPVLLPPAPPTTTTTGTANAQFEIWDQNTSAPPLTYTFNWTLISGPAGGTATFTPGANGYATLVSAAQSPTTSIAYPGQFLTNNVTVTLSTIGTYAIQVSATNGADTITGTVFVQYVASPIVTSSVTATPNPVALGQSIQFLFGVTDPNASPLTFVWNFGDGTTGSGPNPSHTYAAVGTYTVTVTATNQFGLTVSGTTTVTVNPSPIGNFADSDGDGFPDDLEKFLGSSPFDPNSTPTGSAAVTSAYTLNNNGLKIKLKFNKKGQDTISLTGTLPRAGQTPTTGLGITFDVAGVLVSFKLDNTGHATITSNGNVGAQVTGSLSPIKNLGTRNSRFTLKLKGDFAATVAPYGLLNANIKDQRVTVRALVFFNKILYDRFLNLRYTAVQGVSGTTKPDTTAP